MPVPFRMATPRNTTGDVEVHNYERGHLDHLEGEMTHALDPSTVRTRADFVAYVRNLAADAERYRDEWENQDVSRYLEALAAWTQDMDAYFKNRGEDVPEPGWRMFASCLTAGKWYE